MSIIERSSPLNLAYKVIVVTNASSPVGVIVSNTLLKANALVLGTDSHAKDDSLSASTYSHFQFHQCKLTDASAADDIIADAKRKFKADHVDGLVNLMSANDDAHTQEAHQKLAATCAKAMEPALEGGAIVNTVIEAASGNGADQKVIDQLIQATAEASKGSSAKVRYNAVVPGQKGASKPHKHYDSIKEHFRFLFKRLDEQKSKHNEKPTAEKQAAFDFSNTVLFLASGASQGLNGVVIDAHGGHVQD